MSEKLPNQASFKFDDNKNQGTEDVVLSGEEIGMLHALADNPNAEFDIEIQDMAGNVQYSKQGCKNPTGRWGERIDLPIRDNYYKIKVSNAKNCKTVDVFVE